MRTRFRALKVVLATLALAGLLVGTAPGAQATDTGWSTKAKLTLVHGVPGQDGFPVDISVYRLAVGSQVFQDVTFGTVAGPLSRDAGIYWIGIRPADAPRYSTPILSKWITLWPGDNKSVVAHLAADGSPRISVFRNDVSSTGGQARVTVRHLAAAPAVDIWASGPSTGGSLVPVIEDLTNPHQAKIQVRGGDYAVAVAPANTGPSQVVWGPATLTFARNTNTIVYAVGSLGGGSFTPLVQVLPTS